MDIIAIILLAWFVPAVLFFLAILYSARKQGVKFNLFQLFIPLIWFAWLPFFLFVSFQEFIKRVRAPVA